MITLQAVTKKIEVTDESGNIVKFSISQLTAAERERYLNEAQEHIDVDIGPDGTVVGKKMDHIGFHALLLSKCLHGPDDELVGEQVIQTWPASAVQSFFDIAQQVNSVGDDSGDDDPKKD